MNNWIGMGRLTADPEVRVADSGTTVSRFTLAVDRKFKRDEADFIRCVAFKKTAEIVEKYLHRGSKILVEGEIRTDSYTNKDGNKVYTTEIWANNIEFCESKSSAEGSAFVNNGFMAIPDNIDEELPFN